jgi:hypothetical protein
VDTWAISFWLVCVVAAAAGLYALHRLALWLEAHGHLYYINKKPKSSAIGSFVALQRALEPQIQHVIHVEEESHLHGEEGGSGQSDPDDPDAPGTEPHESSGKTRLDTHHAD